MQSDGTGDGFFPAATATGKQELTRTNLTDTRIGALAARKAAYEIRDAKLRGFGAGCCLREGSASSSIASAAAQVRRWFDAWSHTAPSGTNKGLDLLRQIVNFAIARGYVEKNPARGIQPTRPCRFTRFLTREDIACLHRALDGRSREANRQPVDIIRLFLLTGCRRGKIVGLR